MRHALIFFIIVLDNQLFYIKFNFILYFNAYEYILKTVFSWGNSIDGQLGMRNYKNKRNEEKK